MPQNPHARTAMDQRTHIPQHVEAAMNQHMQNSMPAHLKKYVTADRPAYVPQHVEKQIAQYMQKSMPGHLKQYSGAYMQQKVIQPNTANPAASMARRQPAASVAPMPDKLKLAHSAPAQQYNVGWAENPGNRPAPLAPAPGPQNTGPQPAPYDFIMNPEQTPKAKRSLPGGSSLPLRMLFVSGGLLVLFVVFAILKSVLVGGSDFAPVVTVAQDQQQLIHLVNNAAGQQELSTINQNFAATANLSLGSAQSDLVQYLANNKTKVTAKQLSLKIKAADDERLKTAAAATTYNDTFKEILNTRLTEYVTDLQQAYNTAGGEKGRALLSDQYNQAQLLITQLNGSTAAD